MYDCGTPRGLQSGPRVVRPRTSFGPRTILYFSAPGFKTGAGVPAGRPAKLYTPERSGLPSGSRESFFAAFDEAAVFTGVVPATVTVTLFEGPPRIVSVYVVVAAGAICLVPRAATGPISGSIVIPVGFSVP